MIPVRFGCSLRGARPASKRLNKNQLTGNDLFEVKQKELEGVNAMMTNVQLTGKDEFEAEQKELCENHCV